MQVTVVRNVVLILAILVAPVTLAGGSPAWEVMWRDDFERNSLGDAWRLDFGEVELVDGRARFSEFHGPARIARTSETETVDGYLAFRWNPVAISNEWKQFYVGFRHTEPGYDFHRVDFRVDEGDLCFNYGLRGGCVAVAWEPRWYAVNVSHLDGRVQVWLDGEPVHHGTFDPSETATRVSFVAADDGTSQLLDNVVYSSTTSREDARRYGHEVDLGEVSIGGTSEDTLAVNAAPVEDEPESYALTVTYDGDSSEVVRVYTNGLLTAPLHAATPTTPDHDVHVQAGAGVTLVHAYSADSYACLMMVLGEPCLARVPADFTDPSWVDDGAHALRVGVVVSLFGGTFLNEDLIVPGAGMGVALLP